MAGRRRQRGRRSEPPAPDGAEPKAPPAEPPRLWRGLFRLLAPEAGESVLGDIDEEYNDSIRPSRSARSARRWYRRQVLGSLLALWRGDDESPTPRARGGARLMDSILQDLRYSVRSLRRTPGVTASALLVLALGIGGTTAIFTVVRGVLLEPLPYEHRERLVAVWARWAGEVGLERAPLSPSEFVDLRREVDGLDEVTGYWRQPSSINVDGRPHEVVVGQVSSNFFRVLGVQTALGPGFSPEGEPGDVVLSSRLWRQRFGSDPGVIGETLRVGTNPGSPAARIVGVLPPGIEDRMPDWTEVGPEPIDLWQGVLDSWIDFEEPSDEFQWIRAYATIAPGASAASVRAQLDALAARHREADPDKADADFRLHTQTFLDGVVGEVRPVLLGLTGAVVFVLLIACSNVAHLVLVRAHSRAHELRVRLALGAGRGRIARQLLSENVVLALAGGALGLLLASLVLDASLALAPDGVPRIDNVGLEASVVAFALGLSVVTALLFGLAPLVGVARRPLEGLAAQGRVSDRRVSNTLLAGELALSLVLVAGATLLLVSFLNLAGTDPGFVAEDVLTFTVRADRADLRRIEEAIGGLPGVRAVGSVNQLPLAGGQLTGNWASEADVAAGDETGHLADARFVSGDYFEALGVRLLEGRTFRTAESSPVVIVDEKLADSAWPGLEAPRRRLQLRRSVDGAMERYWAEVVGVVEHVRHEDPARDGRPAYYLPRPATPNRDFVALRTAVPPLDLVAPIEQRLHEIVPDEPMGSVRTMSDYLEAQLAPTRFAGWLMALFAAVAVVLTAIGLYGVTAYAVGRREREIGIRLALGARPRGVTRMVLREALPVIASGLLVGLGATVALRRMLASWLYGIEPTDPLLLGGTAALLTAVALSATFLPARRATRVDPIVTLRPE